MDDPRVKSALSRLSLDSSYVGEDEAKQILHVKDDHAFIWSRKDSSLLAIGLNQQQQEDNPVQTISLTDSPMFEVERICSSLSGRWLVLSGSRGVTCVELPRRSGKRGRFANGAEHVTCRSVGIAERFFICQSKLMVQEVQWHPGSAYDAHLVVLASDNYLRIYNIDIDTQTPEQAISLSVRGGGLNGTSSSTFFGSAPLSLQGSLGETAVSFAFAPALPASLSGEEDNDPCANLYPMFVLHGNGNVFSLVTGLGQNKPQPCRVQGPLTMLPESQDNYGSESCSILCLHPLISSPPVLVIATNGGNLNHCVVLNRDDRETEVDEVRSQVSDWSISTTYGGGSESGLSLFVYETVELELGLKMGRKAGDGEEKTDPVKPFDYPIMLHPDPTSPARYFCSHKAGVHCIGLPMVTELAKIAQSPDSEKTVLPCMDEDSVVEHLICTQLSLGSDPAPVLGLAVHYPPTSLIVLLSNFTAQSLALSPPYFGAPPPLLSSNPDQSSSALSTSPLKNRGGTSGQEQQQFEQKIKQILQKSSKHPLVKAGANVNPSKQECLELLMMSTQTLREEYLVRLEQARVEIDRRVSHLQGQKTSQSKSLAVLGRERQGLRDKAGDLSEKYEDIKDNGDRITRRIEVVLQKIQSLNPVATDADLRMQRQLGDMERRLKDLKNGMEQVKQKEKYQLRQIAAVRTGTRKKAEMSEEMGENQLVSIKEVLENDSKEIADMVKKINLAKRDVTV